MDALPVEEETHSISRLPQTVAVSRHQLLQFGFPFDLEVDFSSIRRTNFELEMLGLLILLLFSTRRAAGIGVNCHCDDNDDNVKKKPVLKPGKRSQQREEEEKFDDYEGLFLCCHAREEEEDDGGDDEDGDKLLKKRNDDENVRTQPKNG